MRLAWIDGAWVNLDFIVSVAPVPPSEHPQGPDGRALIVTTADGATRGIVADEADHFLELLGLSDESPHFTRPRRP